MIRSTHSSPVRDAPDPTGGTDQPIHPLAIAAYIPHGWEDMNWMHLVEVPFLPDEWI